MAESIATSWPVRAPWAVPLATAAVTAGELLARRSAADVPAFVLATASGFAMGAWLALLCGLVAVMARRRGWHLPRWMTPKGAAPVLAAALVTSIVVVALGWVALDAGLELVRTRPLDYPQTGTQLGRAVVLLVAPLGVLALVVATGPLVRWLAKGRRARFAIATGTTIAALAIAAHFGGGSFVVYFGAGVALVAVVLGAIAAATWLPSAARGARGAAATAVLVGITVVGILGLRHAGARALLLHHGHLTPTLVALGVGSLDGDGDGDLPPWLGGGDCDDGDERVGIVVPEIPGNGVDDNCWAGDRAATPEAPSPAIVDGPRPLLLLVTIDTVRPDHLELYGAARETMPGLRALGERGLVFERAYAPANHTFFAMTALLAGQATERMITPVPGQQAGGLRYTRWLPQRLRELGYYTVAIAPPLVLDGKLAPAELRVDEIDVGPFDAGEKNRGTTSRQIADAAIDRLERWSGKEPLALWIHFMDPHAVHESPVRFVVERVQDAYDNELSWVDLHLGRVLAAADKKVGEGGALVVVTADHGESFGEDGDWGHGFSLYEREIRVPLVVAGPGVPQGVRRSVPVTTLAVAPTVLGMLGQPRDDGHVYPSLVDADPSPVIAENPAWLWNEARLEAALIEGDHKLVWSRTSNTVQLFDLAGDPEERRNLAAVDVERRDRMWGALRDALEAGR